MLKNTIFSPSNATTFADLAHGPMNLERYLLESIQGLLLQPPLFASIFFRIDFCQVDMVVVANKIIYIISINKITI
jgi:hypothetical protein